MDTFNSMTTQMTLAKLKGHKTKLQVVILGKGMRRLARIGVCRGKTNNNELYTYMYESVKEQN